MLYSSRKLVLFSFTFYFSQFSKWLSPPSQLYTPKSWHRKSKFFQETNSIQEKRTFLRYFAILSSFCLENIFDSLTFFYFVWLLKSWWWVANFEILKQIIFSLNWVWNAVIVLSSETVFDSNLWDIDYFLLENAKSIEINTSFRKVYESYLLDFLLSCYC